MAKFSLEERVMPVILPHEQIRTKEEAEKLAKQLKEKEDYQKKVVACFSNSKLFEAPPTGLTKNNLIVQTFEKTLTMYRVDHSHRLLIARRNVQEGIRTFFSNLFSSSDSNTNEAAKSNSDNVKETKESKEAVAKAKIHNGPAYADYILDLTFTDKTDKTDKTVFYLNQIILLAKYYVDRKTTLDKMSRLQPLLEEITKDAGLRATFEKHFPELKTSPKVSKLDSNTTETKEPTPPNTSANMNSFYNQNNKPSAINSGLSSNAHELKTVDGNSETKSETKDDKEIIDSTTSFTSSPGPQ